MSWSCLFPHSRASRVAPHMAQVSNTFDFMFDITTARKMPDGSAAVLKRVLPASEEEAARTAKHTGTRV